MFVVYDHSRVDHLLSRFNLIVISELCSLSTSHSIRFHSQWSNTRLEDQKTTKNPKPKKNHPRPKTQENKNPQF